MADSERLEQQLRFIVEIDKLKKIVRQSALVDRSRQENDSEHSWHIAVMAFLLSEYANADVDVLKVLKMTLIHDLVEIDAGDTFAYDKVNAKTQNDREARAARRVFGLLPEDQRDELHDLWEEFESMSTLEARFAVAIDRLQPLILSYNNRGWSWERHGVVKSQIVESKRSIGEGSEKLWQLAQELIEAAVGEGFLEDK
ncbi:MAG: HD domain-containing protein [Candidatus Thorarchaeota archaeon]